MDTNFNPNYDLADAFSNAKNLCDLGLQLLQHVYNRLVTEIKSSRQLRRVARRANLPTDTLYQFIKYGSEQGFKPQKSAADSTQSLPTINLDALMAILEALDENKDRPLTRSQMLELQAGFRDMAIRIAQIEQDMEEDDDEDAAAICRELEEKAERKPMSPKEAKDFLNMAKQTLMNQKDNKVSDHPKSNSNFASAMKRKAEEDQKPFQDALFSEFCLGQDWTWFGVNEMQKENLRKADVNHLYQRIYAAKHILDQDPKGDHSEMMLNLMKDIMNYLNKSTI